MATRELEFAKLCTLAFLGKVRCLLRACDRVFPSVTLRITVQEHKA